MSLVPGDKVGGLGGRLAAHPRPTVVTCPLAPASSCPNSGGYLYSTVYTCTGHGLLASVRSVSRSFSFVSTSD
jgi:hypothetical protein